jgi:hypothetical protein
LILNNHMQQQSQDTGDHSSDDDFRRRIHA